MRMSKNGSSLKLCSMVRFILGCRYWNKLYKLLMLPYGHFQNMKQSSRYLFHDLINSIFISLYFLPMISKRFSSKYVKVRMAYIDAILVPIGLCCQIGKLLCRISSIPSMINVWLNLGCNVSGYLSKMRWPAFLIHEGYCLYQFVTSNVTMSVLGSVFCGMKFKKWMSSLM